MTTSCGIESGSSEPSNQGHGTAVGENNNPFSAATTMRSTSLRNRTIRTSNRKRKHTSSSYHPGESSSSLNENSGSCLASSDAAAGRNHATLCHGTPVIDIDGISSPEVRPSMSRYRGGTSIDPNMSAQLEADELLARQLQEQLYNETPRTAPREEVTTAHLFPPPCPHVCAHVCAFSLNVLKVLLVLQQGNCFFLNQIDAIVAMSLQHEEDAVQTSRTIRRVQNDTVRTPVSLF
jgi:hypothetical protein